MTNRSNKARGDSVRHVLKARLRVGRSDHRWDGYTARQIIEEAQQEMLDAALYLEVLKDKLDDY